MSTLGSGSSVLRGKTTTFYGVSLCLALLLTLGACGQPPASTPQACPTPASVVTGTNPVETFVAHADVIVVGTVGEGAPETLAGRSFYRDWEVDVEQYLTDPLPYDTLVVRTFTGATDSAGNRMPVKSPTLAHAQRVLLFLDKDWDEPSLAANEFTIVDLFGGTFWIRDGKVDIRYFGESQEYAPKQLQDVTDRATDLIARC